MYTYLATYSYRHAYINDYAKSVWLLTGDNLLCLIIFCLLWYAAVFIDTYLLILHTLKCLVHYHFLQIIQICRNNHSRQFRKTALLVYVYE